MNLEQLKGRHFRLRQELAVAYSAVPWNTKQIDRLTDDLASTEREIAAVLRVDPLRRPPNLRDAAAAV